MKKLIILLVIIGLGVGGYFIYKEYDKNMEEEKPKINEVDILEDTSTRLALGDAYHYEFVELAKINNEYYVIINVKQSIYDSSGDYSHLEEREILAYELNTKKIYTYDENNKRLGSQKWKEVI